MVATFAGTANRVGNGFGVAFLHLFVTFYASRFDATSYVYCSKIFPTSMRAQGVAASIFGLFSMTLIYTQGVATAFANVGWKYYLVFISVPACGLPILARFPETRGLSLEEISAVFGDEVGLDLTHMTTAEKTILDKEIREGDGMEILHAEIGAVQRRTSVGIAEALEWERFPGRIGVRSEVFEELRTRVDRQRKIILDFTEK